MISEPKKFISIVGGQTNEKNRMVDNYVEPKIENEYGTNNDIDTKNYESLSKPETIAAVEKS